MKKLLSIVIILAMSFLSINALAADSTSKTAPEVGAIVDYNVTFVSKVDGELCERAATNSERIGYMQQHDEVPGSEFIVAGNKYLVLNDYSVKYLGKASDVNSTNLQDSLSYVTRGTSIPTTQGSLPYTGTYLIGSGYSLYTNYYFVVDSYPMNPSIGVAVSANQAQQLTVHWMDGRNDESMGSKTYSFSGAGSLTRFVWAYGSEPFYIKFSNTGTGTASGSAQIYIDQIG